MKTSVKKKVNFSFSSPYSPWLTLSCKIPKVIKEINIPAAITKNLIFRVLSMVVMIWLNDAIHVQPIWSHSSHTRGKKENGGCEPTEASSISPFYRYNDETNEKTNAL